MTSLTRRLTATGVAVGIAALAAALIAVAPGAAAATRHTTAASLAGRHPVITPLRHATPAHSAPNEASVAATSPWKRLANAPPFSPGTMLLASDGSVLVHSEPESGGTPDWYKLTPNAKGNYVNGTWSQIASMPASYDPLYFASAILPDGRMIVEGGEYLGGNPVWTDKGSLYNPVTNTWQSVAPPGGWTNIGDAQSDVLANGTFILAQACQNCTSATGTLSTAQALFNPTGRTWLTLPGYGKNDPNDEEGWTLTQSSQLLTVDTWLTPTTELFTPSTLQWSNAGNTVGSPVNSPAAEIGPQVGMPNGNVLVVGAGSGAEAPAACTTKAAAVTALWHAATGKWTAGPKLPTYNGMQYDSADGPATVLPDGDVLFDTSPCVYNTPLAMQLYNPTSNTISSVPNVPQAANDSTYYTRMLPLPNGQVLFNDGSNDMEVYTAGGTPNAAWAPSINSVSNSTLTPGKTYSLSGTQLSGLDQGAAYGDDVQDNTNFPLVRITNSSSGAVTYARTSNWSSVSIAPGATSSTSFTVPAGTPTGASSLVVVANGIASQPVPVTVP